MFCLSAPNCPAVEICKLISFKLVVNDRQSVGRGVHLRSALPSFSAIPFHVSFQPFLYLLYQHPYFITFMCAPHCIYAVGLMMNLAIDLIQATRCLFIAIIVLFYARIFIVTTT